MHRWVSRVTVASMLNTCTGPSSAAAELGELDMDAVEVELATLDAHINAAMHRRLELIRLIEASGRWAEQGQSRALIG